MYSAICFHHLLVKGNSFLRSFAAQLLVLGYGRPEMHSQRVRFTDKNIRGTRYAINLMKRRTGFAEGIFRHKDNKEEVRELEALVARFDAGPLTLLQLARIAVHSAVGGEDFTRRIPSISVLIPPLLLEYVADPTEELLTSAEMVGPI